MFTFSTLLSPNQFPPSSPARNPACKTRKKRSEQQLLHSTDNGSQSHAVCTFKTHITYMCKAEIQLNVHVGGRLKKKQTQNHRAQYDDENHQYDDMRTSIWEPLLPTSPLQRLLSHITVLRCHRPWERGIWSAQLKAGKRALQTAVARYSFYIQFFQNKEDGSSWQRAFHWEAAFWCPGSQPGNRISARSLINVLQNILPPTVLRVGTQRYWTVTRFAPGQKASSFCSTKMSRFFSSSFKKERKKGFYSALKAANQIIKVLKSLMKKSKLLSKHSAWCLFPFLPTLPSLHSKPLFAVLQHVWTGTEIQTSLGPISYRMDWLQMFSCKLHLASCKSIHLQNTSFHLLCLKPKLKGYLILFFFY